MNQKSTSAEELRGMFPQHRQCNGCTECCTTMGIEELLKPAHTPCQFACAKGCQIYQDKPKSCSIWACMWWMGVIPEEFDPRSTGLTFTPPEQIMPDGTHIVMVKIHHEKKQLWKQNKNLIDWMRACSIMNDCLFLLGTYVSEAMIVRGELCVLSEEVKNQLRRGEVVRLGNGLELKDTGAPDWLRNVSNGV